MNVYVLGAYLSGNLGDDCCMAVLQEKFVTVWPNHDVHFHRPGDTHFCPDETEELVLGGSCRFDDYWLRYPAAMRCFGKRSAMLGLGTQGQLSIETMDRFVPVIDAMALRTVRDTRSARTLRAAGVRSSVCVCADLAYLLPSITPAKISKTGRKPVLAVFAQRDERVAEALEDCASEFEIRPIVYDPEQPNSIEKFRNDLRQGDICMTTHPHGVILCVLENIPFVAIGEEVESECSAQEYPSTLSVRDAWAERSRLKELLEAAKPRRIRLAERNMELLRAMPPWELGRRDMTPEPCGRTLVIWAANDEFWDEARPRLDALEEFDCLIPANSNLKPTNSKKRFALPTGTLMHWAMMPTEITNEIERRYENVVLCHTQNKNAAAPHLLELASRSGRNVWEYGLWMDRFKAPAWGDRPAIKESYRNPILAGGPGAKKKEGQWN